MVQGVHKWSCTTRRTRGDMIEVYKILTRIYDREASHCLKLWKDSTQRSSVRGQSMKLYPQRVNTQIRKNSFAIRVVNTWKSLPESVVSAPSVNTFKNRLDKHWSYQHLKYDFKSQISGDSVKGTTA